MDTNSPVITEQIAAWAVSEIWKNLLADFLIAGFILLFVWAIATLRGKPMMAPTKKGEKLRSRVALSGLIVIGLMGFAHIVLSATHYLFRSTANQTQQLNEIRKGLETGNRVSTPSFDLEFRDTPTISTDVADKSVTTVLFYVSILNKGDLSVVRKWKCTMKLHGDTVFADAVPHAFTLWTPTHQGMVQLPPEKYLPSLLDENGLGKNLQKTGWAYFRFPDNIQTEAVRPGVKLTLQFEDVNGRITAQSWTVPVGYGKKDVTVKEAEAITEKNKLPK